MNTPKSKPSFFYRALFAGALFSFAKADIVAVGISQVPPASSVSTTSSIPIVTTVPAASTASNLALPVDFAPLQPANTNGITPAPSTHNSTVTPKNGDQGHPNKEWNNNLSSHQPESERAHPNFQGHFEWQRKDKPEENRNIDTSKAFKTQNETSTATNRPAFGHPSFNQTKFNGTHHNQTEELSRANHILGNETHHILRNATAQHHPWQNNTLPHPSDKEGHQPSQHQGTFTKSLPNNGKNPQERPHQKSGRNAAQQRERGQGHQSQSQGNNYHHSNGERGTSGIVPQSAGHRRGLYEDNYDEREDRQGHENRDQFEERGNQDREKREDDRFDDEEEEGGQQLSRSRPHRREERRDYREEDDREGRRDDDDWEENDDEWEEEESDYRPRRSAHRSHRNYDAEEDDGNYQDRDSHHHSGRASKGYDREGTNQQRSSHGRIQRNQRSSRGQQQRSSTRGYN